MLIEDRVRDALTEGPATVADLAVHLHVDSFTVAMALLWLEGAHKAHPGEWDQGKSCVRLWHAGPHPKLVLRQVRRGPVRIWGRRLRAEA